MKGNPLYILLWLFLILCFACSPGKKEKKYVVDFVYDKHRFYLKHWGTMEEAVWCRFCYEKYFGLDTIIRNPLFNEYNTLNSDERTEIEAYVVHIIEINIGKPTV